VTALKLWNLYQLYVTLGNFGFHVSFARIYADGAK